MAARTARTGMAQSQSKSVPLCTICAVSDVLFLRLLRYSLFFPHVSFNPFFSVDFEHNPLDAHADNVLEVKMRHLEILYNPKTVDTVIEFFKPPPSEADSINALLEAAGDTLEGLAAQTRAGLEYALEEHKRLDLRVDMDAPVMIFPER